MSLSIYDLMYMPNFKKGKEKNVKGYTWKKTTYQYLELSKLVTRPNPARPATSWPLSGSTQPGSLISEPTKFEPDPTHHGLAG